MKASLECLALIKRLAKDASRLFLFCGSKTQKLRKVSRMLLVIVQRRVTV